jgi:hypothetical protein
MRSQLCLVGFSGPNVGAGRNATHSCCENNMISQYPQVQILVANVEVNLGLMVYNCDTPNTGNLF